LDTEQELVNSLNDFYKSYRSLKIQRSGENTVYDAEKSLGYIFADMISKVEVVYRDTPEGKEKIRDFNYDYRLKFEGARDILFNREGNIFCFEGGDKLYILWGSAESLWDSLIFDTENNIVDIYGEEIRVMSNSYKEDLDGDGKDEDIDKVLLVHYSSVTNGSVGSKGKIKAYKYINGHISEVELKNVERVVKYKGDNIINVYFPAFKRNIDFRADPENVKMFLEKENISEQQLETIDTYDSHRFGTL